MSTFPLLGPFLRMHLAGNGVDKFIEKYARSYHYRWKSMETWTSIPVSARESVIQGVHAMDMVRSKTLDHIKGWRDGMLVKILRLVVEGRR